MGATEVKRLLALTAGGLAAMVLLVPAMIWLTLRDMDRKAMSDPINWDDYDDMDDDFASWDAKDWKAYWEE